MNLTDKMILRAQASWAAEHLNGVEAEDITGIVFENEDGHYYSEYTYEDGGTFVAVTLNDGTTRRFQVYDIHEVIHSCMVRLAKIA